MKAHTFNVFCYSLKCLAMKTFKMLIHTESGHIINQTVFSWVKTKYIVISAAS